MNNILYLGFKVCFRWEVFLPFFYPSSNFVTFLSISRNFNRHILSVGGIFDHLAILFCLVSFHISFSVFILELKSVSSGFKPLATFLPRFNLAAKFRVLSPTFWMLICFAPKLLRSTVIELKVIGLCLGWLSRSIHVIGISIYLGLRRTHKVLTLNGIQTIILLPIILVVVLCLLIWVILWRFQFPILLRRQRMLILSSVKIVRLSWGTTFVRGVSVFMLLTIVPPWLDLLANAV